ncbi:ATP-binding cassette domain-containing protein, partial [Streptococcus salivarius]
IVVLTILLTICLTYLPKPFATKMQHFMSLFSTANEELISGLNDQLSGYKTLYYSNKKPTLLIQNTKIIRNYITQKVNFTQNSTRIETIMSAFSIMAQMSILFLTGLLITLGQVSIGSISSVGQISGNIFNSLTTLNQLQVSIHSVKPLFLKFEVSSKHTEKRTVNNIENIDISDLEYNFGNKTVFSKLNLNLVKNKKYAIIGESGSGKSTLINIILGNLQNYTGHVKYNNLELKEIDENSIVSQVAYISNSTHIYNDTLENNLTLWSQDITQNEIKKALKNVNLLDLQGRLKEKVSNDLLSEGQKQRIGIARALLKGSKIIIMDEATANLDKTNADFIENNLLKNPDITYITVTHHLSSEREKYFDQIIKLA